MNARGPQSLAAQIHAKPSLLRTRGSQSLGLKSLFSNIDITNMTGNRNKILDRIIR
jgi:hypothetical protein